jgi:two-component system, OmpR family, phosphate regulon sensor histidine kinase PhoR
VANAVRYGCTTKGMTVTIEVRRDGDRALLAVRDQGEGIAAEHLPRLTERFYRVDDARSRDGGGTGLGLAIVKHIVERHSGTLDIRSAPGRGTSVEVRLPLP